MSTITPGSSNYISNGDVMAWLESKTDSLYGQMRDSMDIADTRSHLEDDLNNLKDDITNLKKGGDQNAVQNEIDQLLQKYPDQPEVAATLKPMSDAIKTMTAANEAALITYAAAAKNYHGHGSPPTPPVAQGVDGSTADQWADQIKEKVEFLGKQDQLGLINIQELNANINQAKQVASNLIDALNRSESSIIQNIKA